MAYFRTGTNDFSSIKYTNLEAGNIKKGVTVTIKDPNDITLKSVTGTYDPKIPIQLLKGHTVRGRVTISSDQYTLYAYYDGALISSHTQSIYLSDSLTVKYDGSSRVNGGYSLIVSRTGMNDDKTTVSITLNGQSLGSATSSAWGGCDTGNKTIS